MTGQVHVSADEVGPLVDDMPVSGGSIRRVRNRVHLLGDLAFFSALLALAYTARFEGLAWPAPSQAVFLRFLPIAVLLVKIPTLYGFGLYRRLWRHAGMAELRRIAAATVVFGAAELALGAWLLPAAGILPVRVPLSVLILDIFGTPLLFAGPRLIVRGLLNRTSGRHARTDRRVLIAGAGSAGEQIARELRSNPELGLIPVGYVDDDTGKHGMALGHLTICGGFDRLADIRDRLQADELIIAMPSASGRKIREVLRRASEVGMPSRTIPALFDILSGRVALSSIRPVQIEDLLRREPIQTNLDQVRTLVHGKTVLVTGAGGSIGSELSRQIAGYAPARILLLGHGENSIFAIHGELRTRYPTVECVPVIADVRDRTRLLQVLEPTPPDVIFHAAAHKHVPLMETNVAEAVTNNVLGTRNVVRAALALEVERLVLISTDKAVRPTSVMGATKRVAEYLVHDAAVEQDRNFIAVRFGNVLGSRGSVVPYFLNQIARGGPVTVTHPEMRRYFMTIPEAVQLVLQAAVQGKGGEVFVLDMGEPVRIVDLASDLIRLSGLEVGRDVAIEYTGVRPGERLYEEMFFSHEVAEPTDHDKVLKAKNGVHVPDLYPIIDRLIRDAQNGAGDGTLTRHLSRLVVDYHPEDSAHNIAGTKAKPAAPAGAQSRY